jgi:DNA integrity scanning protein DisA with diadenylate cyclase activity
LVVLADLVESALSSGGGYDRALLIGTNSRKLLASLARLPPSLPRAVLTSQRSVMEAVQAMNEPCSLLDERLSSQRLGMLTSLHDLVLQTVGEHLATHEERYLVVLADPIEGVLDIDTGSLESHTLVQLAEEADVDIDVVTSVLSIARSVADRGREGHSIGALLAIGSLPQMRRHSKPLVLNPFKGHSTERRSVLREENHETILEFAWLDGAIFLNRSGVASDAGRYVQVTSDVPIHSGEGGRHLAAKALSLQAGALAVCASSSGRVTVYWRGRTRYTMQVR